MFAKVGRSYPAPAWARRSNAIAIRAQTYHSATTSRRARGWFAPTLGPNDAILPNARTLVSRSRAAVRNDGYAGRAIDRLVSNIVGTGILPQSKAPDRAFRERVQQLWLDWTDECDATERLEFYGMQAQAVRGWLEGGEIFVRIRRRLPTDGLSVPLQLELIEPELCPIEHTLPGGGGMNRTRAGIEFDAIGRRVAYWFYRQRPGEFQDLGTGELVRVPADSVAHLYDPLRAGQIRGVPQLTQALLKLYDLDQYDDATLLRQKLANMFLAFLKRQGPTPDPELDPTGKPIERDSAGEPLIAFQPGMMLEGLPGEELTWSEPPEAPGYDGFMRAQLMGASVAADVPYEVLTGDLRQVNDRTVRVILNEFRRRIEQRQHHIVAFQLNRPVWAAWFERAVFSGALEVPAEFFENPTPWMRVEWIAPAWPYLHPVQDVQHEQLMVRSGFKSRTQVAKERGYDVEQIEREMADDNQRADALGLVFDSDPRKTDAKGAGNRAAGEPEPEPEPAAEGRA